MYYNKKINSYVYLILPLFGHDGHSHTIAKVQKYILSTSTQYLAIHNVHRFLNVQHQQEQFTRTSSFSSYYSNIIINILIFVHFTCLIFN